MRSSFSRCGRYAFARGNSSWARNFNASLHSARGTVPTSFASSPFTWRVLSGASPMISNAVNVMMVASEAPSVVGYAEQAGCVQSGMICSTESSTDEVAESGDDAANILSSAPAGSHITLLKNMTVTHYSESRHPTLNLHRRSAVEASSTSMQSRLSQLAAALSPSNSVTPVSRRESPTPMTSSASPILNLRDLHDSYSPADVRADEGPVPHYPIDTPPFDFEEEDPHVAVEEAKMELQKYWECFQEKSKFLIDELRRENDRKEAIKNQLLSESAKREESMLRDILSAISAEGSFEQNILHKVEERIALHRKEETQKRRECMQEIVDNVGTEKVEEIQRELLRIESEKRDSETSVDYILAKHLERIDAKIDAELGKSKGLVEENQRLRSLVRRMKISMAKWRVDYMQYARDQEPKEVVVKQIVKERIADDQFSHYSQNLGKLWTACGPSNYQLVDFLARIENAVNNGSNLSKVYRDECEKAVEKLPLAQLAAKREFLLSKPNQTLSHRLELDQVTSELTSLILDYENKHQESFIYDGQDYSRNLDRVQVRDN